MFQISPSAMCDVFENFAERATAPCLCCTIGDLEHYSVSAVVTIYIISKQDGFGTWLPLSYRCFPDYVGFGQSMDLEIKSKADSSPFQSDTLLHSFVNLKQGWFLFSSVILSGGMSSERSMCNCFGNLKFGSSTFASSCF